MIMDNWSVSARMSLLLGASAWGLWALLAYIPAGNVTFAVTYSLLALPLLLLTFILATAGLVYGLAAYKTNRKHGAFGIALAGSWLVWGVIGAYYSLLLMPV